MRVLDLRRRQGPPREPLIQLREYAEQVGIDYLKLRSMLGHTPDHLRPRREFWATPVAPPYYYRKSVLDAWLDAYQKEKTS